MPQAAAPTPKPLHIFKPGRFTSMAGESIEFSAADLQATAAAFDPALSKAPIVVGHPRTDAPAQGWAASLQATDRGLFAVPTQVDPAFAESVRAGRFGTVSAKFYRPTDPNNPKPGVWYLRHIGFLGAQNPAVKGLDDPAFADEDQGVCFQEGVAFSGEWDDMTNSGLWRRLRDWLIGQFGQDVADRVVPSYDVSALEASAIQEVQEAAAEAASPAPAAFSENQESTVTEAEAQQLREQNAALATQLTQLRTQATQAKCAQAHADHVAFAEGLIDEGRLLPAHKDVAVATLDHLAAQDTPVEFGEGDARQPLATGLQALLKALPVQVDLTERATQQRAAGATQGDDDAAFAEADPERLAQHRAVQAHMAAHKVDYATAARAVIK